MVGVLQQLYFVEEGLNLFARLHLKFVGVACRRYDNDPKFPIGVFFDEVRKSSRLLLLGAFRSHEFDD